MKIYLAARYSRRLELCGYRAELEALGHIVTSRWLNGDHQISDNGTPIGEDGESLVEFGETEGAARLRAHFADEDISDIESAEVLITFTEPPRSSASRGGRHVEYGYALALGISVIVIGHRENVFHWLSHITFYETWGELLRQMAIGQVTETLAGMP